MSSVEAEQLVSEPFDSLEAILIRIARGLIESQRHMDQYSMATQITIDNDETLSKYGFEAPWFHFAETDIDLKLALHLVGEKKEVSFEGKKLQERKPRLMAFPLNAQYVKRYGYDVSLASTVKTKIVPIPSRVQKTEQG